ncbi:MAG: hypothetical protein EOO88_43730 [Pedobacter sp.]|nr:MAG: hypothetical protein EOO88_43730 [Pedobacter sp.]
MNTINVDKFCGLLFYLSRSKTEFEMVADEIEDPNLRTALDGLSSESSQYAKEIAVQLKTLGVGEVVPHDFFENCVKEGDASPEVLMAAGRGNELMQICNQSETTITNAYWEILNEYVPFASLKDIMVYQLNSLKHAFSKIKILNAARFSA